MGSASKNPTFDVILKMIPFFSGSNFLRPQQNSPNYDQIKKVNFSDLLMRPVSPGQLEKEISAKVGIVHKLRHDLMGRRSWIL